MRMCFPDSSLSISRDESAPGGIRVVASHSYTHTKERKKEDQNCKEAERILLNRYLAHHPYV